MRFAVLLAFFWTFSLFAPDSYYCPMRCEGTKTYEAAGTCPVCHMYLVKKGDESDDAPLSLKDYRIDFATDPTDLKVGVEGRLNLTPKFTKDGKVLRDLEEVHGTEMEVYLTNQDLTFMLRARPVLLEGGTFSLKHTFESGGNYILYTMIVPKGKRPQVFPVALKVAGPSKTSVVHRKKEAVTSFKDKVTMRTPAAIQSGQPAALSFQISREELQKKKLPVTKEFAYVIWVSRDTTRFIPTHAAIKEVSKGKWRIDNEIKFPRPGIYTAFLELWNTSEMVSFDVTVK